MVRQVCDLTVMAAWQGQQASVYTLPGLSEQSSGFETGPSLEYKPHDLLQKEGFHGQLFHREQRLLGSYI